MSTTHHPVRGTSLRLPPLPWRLVAVGYVLVDTILGAVAFSSDRDRPTVEVAAFLLALPAVVVTIPGIYVVGALAWNLRDALAGRPMWPVTVTFTCLFALTALANVLLAWVVYSRTTRAR
jgi:hypothetical protein